MNTQSKPKEEAFAFDCEGSELIGVIHHSPVPAQWGMLCIVAGGPQYRGGCGRQLVELGRDLSSKGFPVMRFDHRGLGDGGGEFEGFECLESDISSAIEAFKTRVPSLENIVLWGGCDAASAALMNAHQLSGVASVVAANPWVSTSETAARVRKKHYGKRLGEWSFWRKLFTLQYSPLQYVREYMRRRQKRDAAQVSGNRDSTTGKTSYVERMRDGVQLFEGPLLFLMSGRSLVSREFDELVSADRMWKTAYSRPSIHRLEIKDADQTFSTRDARDAMIAAAAGWMESLSAGLQQERGL